jgi:hypothetical protein
LQTEGYELISSNTSFKETIVSLPALCANYGNVTFRHRTVVSITPPRKVILLSDGELLYDTLIIALGSVTKFFECDDNVYNYSSGAKSLRGALRLNQFFQDELYKRLESDKKAKESFNIIVGGNTSTRTLTKEVFDLKVELKGKPVDDDFSNYPEVTSMLREILGSKFVERKFYCRAVFDTFEEAFEHYKKIITAGKDGDINLNKEDS